MNLLVGNDLLVALIYFSVLFECLSVELDPIS